MRFGFSLVTFGGIFLAAASLSSALANARDVKKPMEFAIVRWDSKTCGLQCPEWIAAQGRIDGGSFIALQKIVQSLKGRKLPILIDSIGGDVDAGLKMGRLIRDKGLDVVVARTLPARTCLPKDVACLKQARRAPGPRRALHSVQQSRCASSCTFILAGGVRRVAVAGARIGVHQVTVTETQRTIDRRFHIERRRVNGRVVEVSRRLISERVVSQKTIKLKTIPKETVDRIEAHFTTMGMDPSFFALTMATPPDRIRVLSQSEVQSTRIGTDGLEDVLRWVGPPANRE